MADPVPDPHLVPVPVVIFRPVPVPVVNPDSLHGNIFKIYRLIRNLPIGFSVGPPVVVTLLPAKVEVEVEN
ncbi:UNVERIFIED_CONTAM: hypothetical protein RMT77_019839 [Armadillidium vulgare]